MVEWDNIATQSKYHKLKSRNHESFSPSIHPSPTTNVLYNEMSLWWFNIYLTYFHTTRKKRSKKKSRIIWKKDARIIVYSKICSLAYKAYDKRAFKN